MTQSRTVFAITHNLIVVQNDAKSPEQRYIVQNA